MNAFLIAIVGLALVSLLFVVPPLLRKPTRVRTGRGDVNVVIYRQRLAELETDRAAGTLSEEQFEDAHRDLERELLSDIQDELAPASPAPEPARATAWLMAVILPLTALGLYWKLGSWEAVTQPLTAGAGTTADTTATNGELHSVDEMIVQLEARLREQPEDVRGWVMLARSYGYLNRYGDAEKAYAHAYELAGDESADLIADYAEAMAMARDAQLAGEPEALINKALSIEPGNQKTLWLAGMAAYQRQQFADAIRYWQQLATATPADSEEASMLADYIDEARTRMQQAGQTESAPAPPPEPATNTAVLKVSVNLDPALAAQAPPDATVFIFARAAEGPRMPLAIVRKQVRDLPVTVQLDDSMAMMPTMKLSGFPQVVVGARVSKTGQATPTSGDLEGMSEPLSPSETESLTITIDSVTP